MKQRLTLTLTDESVLEIKRLRDILVAESNYQISIASVVRKLVKDALASHELSK
jgi:hypothetical protein